MQFISVYDVRPGQSGTLSFTVSDVAELRLALVAAGVEKVEIESSVFIGALGCGSIWKSTPLAPDRLPDDLFTQIAASGSPDSEGNGSTCALTAVS